MSPSPTNTLPLSVAQTGFLLDRLGMDCAPLQFLRELTQNAVEAIKRTPTKSGEIIWDVDWITYDLGDFVYKLSVTDTGDGMTGEEMLRYLNHLSSSGSIQSHFANFGIGAKIAAATRNHHGLVYLSWKAGLGSMIHLWRDPQTGDYGLQQLARPDGTFGHWAHVDSDVKPPAIVEHGTKVVLLGNAADENTMRPPAGSASPSRWITKYLNTRYFRFPDGITVKAREGWENDRSDTDRNLLRTITGQAKYLERHTAHSGKLRLDGAVAHWWILKDEGALSQNSGIVASSGHVAALWQDELYEMTTGRSSTAALQNFGVVFGYQQVVIYVEPLPDTDAEITTNTARTNILINYEPVPWADWQAEFRDKMPDEIALHMERVAAGAHSEDHSESIRERLKQIEELFKLSRYRPAQNGLLRIDAEELAAGGKPRENDGQRGKDSGAASSSKGGKQGSIYSLFLADDGPKGEETRPDVFPQVVWISAKNGSRASGDLEDRAARYLRTQNILLINADFRVFTDMVERWTKQYSGVPGVAPRVEEIVHEWFQQSLVEAVISSNSLRETKHWSTEEVDKALLSEEGLSAVVLPRWHIEQSIKRSLGSKLGSLKGRAA